MQLESTNCVTFYVKMKMVEPRLLTSIHFYSWSHFLILAFVGIFPLNPTLPPPFFHPFSGCMLKMLYIDMIFQSRCDEIAEALKQQGLQAAALHGGRSQSERETALRDFRHGPTRILVRLGPVVFIYLFVKYCNSLTLVSYASCFLPWISSNSLLLFIWETDLHCEN